MGNQGEIFAFAFGSIIASILLLIHGGIVGYVIYEVIICAGKETCANFQLHDGLVYVFTTTGGLVSALVIAKLSLVDPTEPDREKTYASVSGVSQVENFDLVFWVTISYLSVWLLAGLSSLIVGVLLYPEINQTLGDLGTTWLGLAVAAGYSYFGIRPK